jgi:hypothetical protein
MAFDLTHNRHPRESGDPVRRGHSALSSAFLEYWIARRSLSSGRPKGRTGWRAMTTETRLCDLAAYLREF